MLHRLAGILEWFGMVFVLGLALADCSTAGYRGASQVEPEAEAHSQDLPGTQTPTPDPASYADLQDFGPAPELENEVWLNTDQPLRLADLRGKVVLLDMWTFG